MSDSKTRFSPPDPRPPIADPNLTRPDWTTPDARDAAHLWLDRNENTDPGLEALVAGIVRDLPPETFRIYPNYAPTYAKLARHLGIPAENLVMAGGSDGIIRLVFDAYVSPGDRIVHTDPTFGMYPVYCQMYGASTMPASYRRSDAGPVLDIGDMIETIRTTAPRIVCLPNPDSPTGTVVSRADLRAVVEAAGEAGSLMLIDEAYYPFHPETALPWIAEYGHLVVMRSTSKAWGMAGLRLGFAAASTDVVPYLHKVRPNYGVTTPAVAVLDRLLDRYTEIEAAVARLNAGKAAFVEAMTELGLTTLPGHGNFLHVAFGAHADAVHAVLADLVMYRCDFAVPCLKGFSRFTSTTAERFAPVSERIASVVRRA